MMDFSRRFSGRWVAVGGNRWISRSESGKVERITKILISAGCRIVTGGAEGVDHAAMRACLGYGIPKSDFRVYLPYTIQRQYLHYRGLEKAENAKRLLQTLEEIKKGYPGAIIENTRGFADYRKAANFRNGLIIKRADAAIIFKPAGSRGTGDALRRIKGKKLESIIYR